MSVADKSWRAFLCLDSLSLLKGDADVVGAVDRGIVHNAVPTLKGEFRQGVCHFLEDSEEIVHVRANRLRFLNLYSNSLQPVFAVSNRLAKLS